MTEAAVVPTDDRHADAHAPSLTRLGIEAGPMADPSLFRPICPICPAMRSYQDRIFWSDWADLSDLSGHYLQTVGKMAAAARTAARTAGRFQPLTVVDRVATAVAVPVNSRSGSSGTRTMASMPGATPKAASCGT